jgi:GTP cyclohydrolase IA
LTLNGSYATRDETITALSNLDPLELKPGLDLARVEAAVSDLLVALGVDISRGGTVETPRRVARMYADLLTPRAFCPTTFPNEDGYDELVLMREIPFVSLCEHHLLPFQGVAHVGYLPGQRIIGLSKLARLVHFFAGSLQLQERLTKQVADWLRDELSPKGVGVILVAEHQCMTIRGVKAVGSKTVTSTLYGLLRDNPASRHEFFDLTGIKA